MFPDLSPTDTSSPEEGRTIGSRPETSCMRFGNDWTGVFVRGDNAFYYAQYLKMAINRLKADGKNSNEKSHDAMIAHILEGLMQLLVESDERVEDKYIQEMKEFKECLK